MPGYYETDSQETPDSAITSAFDKGALESRIKEAEPVSLGAPNQMADTPVHNQGNSPDCLLQSARMAEHRQTGTDPGLESFKNPAIEKGLYDPQSGTDLARFVDVINERPGIEAQLQNASGPEDIKAALDNGESVIAGVDAQEFYKNESNLELNASGHAIVVTGADQAPNGSWEFTVNDPNDKTPNKPVDGDRFLSAWNNADRTLITVRAKGGA